MDENFTNLVFLWSQNSMFMPLSGIGWVFYLLYPEQRRKKTHNFQALFHLSKLILWFLYCEMHPCLFRKGNVYTLLWEYKLVWPLSTSVLRFLKKLKTELSYDPAIPLLGIYQKECKSVFNRDTWTLMHTATLFTIANL
jgi:hypothetical protein